MTLTQQQPTSIKIRTTNIKKVYVGTNQVRPAVPPHTFNGDLTQAALLRYNGVSGYIIYGIALSDDGTKLYYQTNNGNRTAATLHQFDLSTAWDTSTMTNEKTLTFGSSSAAWGVYPKNILFKNSGRYLYLLYGNSGPEYIEWYTLSTPWDISTASLTYTLSTGWSDKSQGVYISDDGTEMWVMSNDGIYYKQLTTQRTPEIGTLINNMVIQMPFVSPDGYYAYEDNGGTIKQYEADSSFDFTNLTQIASLNKVNSGNYGMGVYFNPTGTLMFTVKGGVSGQIIYTYEIS